MLVITQRLARPCQSDVDLLLSFELRSKTRLRTRSVSGEEAGLFLPAGGAPLADGQCLLAEDGRVVRVLAADEPLLHVCCANPLELCRAAYHLGNRHVHLQVGDGWLRLLDDYVLEQMLQQLGAEVSRLSAPFNPESGAYGGGHHHSHGKEAAFQYAPRLHLFGQPA